MNVICPLAHKTTVEAYKTELSNVMGQVGVLNDLICSEISESSVLQVENELRAVINKIQNIKARLEVDVQSLKKSNFLCCYLDHRRFVTISTSCIETGMVIAGGIIAYNDNDISSKALGIACLVIGQVLSKANDYLADRSKQMSKRETGLKERLINAQLLEDSTNEALKLLRKSLSNQSLNRLSISNDTRSLFKYKLDHLRELSQTDFTAVDSNPAGVIEGSSSSDQPEVMSA